MKKFVSCRLEYYNHTKENSLRGHSKRLFQYEENVLPPEERKEKLYENIHPKDHKLFKDVEAEHRKVLGKKSGLRKSRNTYIGLIVVYSEEYFLKWLEENKENWKELISERLEKFAFMVQKEFGLEYLRFDHHMDEGKRDIFGNLYLNVHSHIGFYNFSFEKKQSLFRSMKKADFQKLQTMVYECFKDLGFERGISAKGKRTKHLSKNQLISKVNNEILDFLQNNQDKFKKLMNEDLKDKTFLSINNKVKDKLDEYLEENNYKNLEEFLIEKLKI